MRTANSEQRSGKDGRTYLIEMTAGGQITGSNAV